MLSIFCLVNQNVYDYFFVQIKGYYEEQPAIFPDINDYCRM